MMKLFFFILYLGISISLACPPNSPYEGMAPLFTLQLVPNRPNHIPLLSTNRGEQLSLPRQDRCGEERDHLEQRDGGQY